MAFDRLDPFGDGRGDLRAGIIASTLANINRDAQKRPEPFSPIDFMPYMEAPPIEEKAPDFDSLIAATMRKT